MDKTNSEIDKKNKKADKKALKILMPILAVAFLVGVFIGFLSSLPGENTAETIANGIGWGLKIISPYVNLVMNSLVLLVSVILLCRANQLRKAWDGENEEHYEKIDGLLSVVTIMAQLSLILSYFFFAVGAQYCIGVIGDGTGKSTWWEIICFFAGFVLGIVEQSVMQAKAINIYKLMNPEKNGSAYDINFDKKWEESCDENEKMKIYKSAYGSHKFTTIFYIGLWLALLVGNDIFHFGLMPIFVMTLVWLAQFISYQAYGVYYEKNPNKM